MKKRICHRILLLFLFCILISFAACQKGSNEPDGNGSFNQKGGNEPNGNDGLSQKIDGQGLTEAQKENAFELKGTAFGKLPAVGTEDPIYCNLPENLMDMFAILPLCHDPLYDILYYVNYNEDFMIYAVRDGKSEVAVPFSGKRLFCRQGKLYFLLDTDTDTPVKGAKNGNILSYDPVTGEVHVVVDDVFTTITVYQDCILCSKVGSEDSSINNQFYFYDTGELLATENYFPSFFVLPNIRYKDYFVATDYDSNPYKSILCRLDSNETIPLDGFPDINSFSSFLKGDDIIWFREDSIHFWNIPSKEERILEINKKQEGAYSLFYDNYFYTGRGGYIDIENGISQKGIPLFSNSSGSEISEFHTDGERIYGFAATIDDMNSLKFPGHLCCVEWRSLEEALALFAENEKALEQFHFAQEQALQEDGEPLEGILLLTPIDQLFQ